ncbi:MAG: hypothetical protein A2Y07_06495 [Planctomycetes bacterium GWF2_50_10]|nr:MAG: hypothetical protein A2Y07_06495 [Planctomycetes bacterium GWF2_50_10]
MKKNIALMLIVMVLVQISRAMAGVSIDFSVQEPLNKVINNSFDQLGPGGTTSLNWGFIGETGSFKTSFPYEKDRNKIASITALNGIDYGYFQQGISFSAAELNKEYVVECSVKQIGGCAMIEISGCGIYLTTASGPSNKALPVAGAFVPGKFIKGVENEENWRKISIKFTPTLAGTLYLNFGNNRYEGTVWFDDVKVCPSTTSLKAKVKGDTGLQSISIIDESGQKIYEILGSQIVYSNGTFELNLPSISSLGSYKVVVVDHQGTTMEKRGESPFWQKISDAKTLLFYRFEEDVTGGTIAYADDSSDNSLFALGTWDLYAQGGSGPVYDAIEPQIVPYINENCLGPGQGYLKSNASASDKTSLTMNMSNGFTVEAWIKLATDVGNLATIASVYEFGSSASTNNWFFGILRNGGMNKLYSEIVSAEGTYTYWLMSNTGLSTNTWYHIALIYNKAMAKAEFLVNGNPAGSANSIPGVRVSSGRQLTVGATESGSHSFNGSIDELRVSSSVRNGADLLCNVDSCKILAEQGLGLVGDINNDCKIDLKDIAILMFNWMDCNNPKDNECVGNWF